MSAKEKLKLVSHSVLSFSASAQLVDVRHFKPRIRCTPQLKPDVHLENITTHRLDAWCGRLGCGDERIFTYYTSYDVKV